MLKSVLIDCWFERDKTVIKIRKAYISYAGTSIEAVSNFQICPRVKLCDF